MSQCDQLVVDAGSRLRLSPHVDGEMAARKESKLLFRSARRTDNQFETLTELMDPKVSEHYVLLRHLVHVQSWPPPCAT